MISQEKLSEEGKNFFLSSSIKKIQQIAAFFSQKNGGKISSDVFMKLAYIANRYMLEQHEYELWFEETIHVSSGSPVLINAEMNIKKSNEFILYDGIWIEFLENSGFDELSRSAIKILEKTWNMHGHQTNDELIYYMKNLYLELKLEQITYLDIMKAMNKEIL